MTSLTHLLLSLDTEFTVYRSFFPQPNERFWQFYKKGDEPQSVPNRPLSARLDIYSR